MPVCPQVSHHPPVSAFHVSNRKDGFCISGSITAKSRFYGEEAGRGSTWDLVTGFISLPASLGQGQMVQGSDPGVRQSPCSGLHPSAVGRAPLVGMR